MSNHKSGEGIIERLKSDIHAGETEWHELFAGRDSDLDDHMVKVPIRRLSRAVNELEHLTIERDEIEFASRVIVRELTKGIDELKEERDRYREALEGVSRTLEKWDNSEMSPPCAMDEIWDRLDDALEVTAEDAQRISEQALEGDQ